MAEYHGGLFIHPVSVHQVASDSTMSHKVRPLTKVVQQRDRLVVGRAGIDVEARRSSERDHPRDDGPGIRGGLFGLSEGHAPNRAAASPWRPLANASIPSAKAIRTERLGLPSPAPRRLASATCQALARYGKTATSADRAAAEKGSATPAAAAA